jgi:hypothetical protein
VERDEQDLGIGHVGVDDACAEGGPAENARGASALEPVEQLDLAAIGLWVRP